MLHNIQISVCINKILPKHSHGICSHSVYDYFPATVPELRVVTETIGTANWKISMTWPIREKVCCPLT